MRDQSALTDYFLLCSATSDRQIRAITNGVWEDAKQKGEVVPMSREGDAQSGWVLVDFGNLIVHVFSEEKRHYYNLEGLWQDAHIVLRMP